MADMNRAGGIVWSGLLTLMLLTAACRTTRVESVRARNGAGGGYRHLLVVATIEKAEERTAVEETMRKALENRGFETMTGSEILPPPGERTEERYISALTRHGRDAVLVVTPRGRGTIRTPDSPWGVRDKQVEEPSTGCNPKDGGLGPRFEVKGEPMPDETVSWSETLCTLFGAGSGERVWEGIVRSRVTARTPFRQLAAEQSRAVVDRLMEDGLLAPGEEP